MREPDKAGCEAEAYAVARKFLGRQGGSRGLSRYGSRAVMQVYDMLRRKYLVKEVEAMPLSEQDKAEVAEAIQNYKPARSKRGPNPRDMEFRNFVICWVIQGIERLGHSHSRARSIVVEVLAELGNGLDEDSVKGIWDSRGALSIWPRIVEMNVWPR